MNQQRRAASFQSIGQEYDRTREGFPDRAVDFLIPTPVGTALDVGAGTGRFTDLLVARAQRVIAVDPSDQMLAVLRARYPQVESLTASAEQLPLPDASVDVVTVAQAFHWFDRDAACAEFSRVLRPGGVLGLVWNGPDVNCSLDAAFYRLFNADFGQVTHPHHREQPGFGFEAKEIVVWSELIDPELFLERWRTRSTYLMAGPERRAELDDAFRSILDSDPLSRDGDAFELPIHTEVYRYRKLDSDGGGEESCHTEPK